MQSPGSQGTRDASTPEIEEVFSLAADPQLAENSRQGSERKNRAFALGFEELKSQTMQWGSWQARGRTASVPTVYLYDGRNLLEEADGSGNVLGRYAQGPGTDQLLAELRSGTTSYYQQDALSSVTSLSNSVGALANTYSYDSFGKLTASTGTLVNPFQYTGGEFDSETGIYEYRARYFDPTIGRFISEDPIRFKAGLDFYVYVKNGPIIRSDPTGLIHQAWGESPYDGRLHDDPGAGLEALCSKGRNIKQDMEWLEHSIFVRSVEIDALGNDASAGHIDRRDAEIETLERCHDECDKDKKPEPQPNDVPFWENIFKWLYQNSPPLSFAD